MKVTRRSLKFSRDLLSDVRAEISQEDPSFMVCWKLHQTDVQLLHLLVGAIHAAVVMNCIPVLKMTVKEHPFDWAP